jgi:carboxylesterase
MAYIIPTAEPFLFPGGSTGCLLIHGFTGAPKEMRWMGEHLAKEGFSVLGVRLAGHATRPEDMARTRWQDWMASVEDGWHFLGGVSQQIFVMGLSLGGILALLFSSQHPVAGVVAMSTPYNLPDDPRLRFIKLFSLLQPRMAKGTPDWHNPEAAKDHIDYPYTPTREIAELPPLLLEMQAALPKIHVPALLMHSRQDQGVPPENMEKIYAALGTMDKQMIWLEKSGHVIVREPERLRVFCAAVDFIRRVNEQTNPGSLAVSHAT